MVEPVQELDWKSIWQAALAEWQLSASTALFETCLKKTHIVTNSPHKNGLHITLGIPNWFWQDELKRRFHQPITDTLARLTQQQVTIDYVVASNPEPLELNDTDSLFAVSKPEINVSENFIAQLRHLRLEPERSLENFAVSSSNEMAYAAAKAVAQRPGAAYNPLFLYGGVGVGKTHLMQGIAQEILKKDMGLKIIYCTGEEFTNAIIEAIQKKSTISFRGKYRSVRLLLIDDIQFIAGKNSVQEEFFHTFNAITTEGGQIIMTSDKPPKEIDSLEDRLRSRFEGGLTIDIGKPNFELRCAILMIKAHQLKIELPSDVGQYIATNEEDTRALVGRLLTLSTLAQSRGVPLNLALAQETFVPQKPSIPVKPTPDAIIQLVCNHYQQPKEAVLGTKRIKQLTLPRHTAMYLLKEDLGLNLMDIGKRFSNRDHTSVMHAIKKITSLMKDNQEVYQTIQQLRSQV